MSALAAGQWALRYDRCQTCGTKDRPHECHGLCKSCYIKSYWRANDRFRAKRRQYDQRRRRAELFGEPALPASPPLPPLEMKRATIGIGGYGFISGTIIDYTEDEDGEPVARVQLEKTRHIVAFPVQFVEVLG